MSKEKEAFKRIKGYFNPKQLLTKENTLNDLDCIEQALDNYGKIKSLLDEYSVVDLKQLEMILREASETKMSAEDVERLRQRFGK